MVFEVENLSENEFGISVGVPKSLGRSSVGLRAGIALVGVGAGVWRGVGSAGGARRGTTGAPPFRFCSLRVSSARKILLVFWKCSCSDLCNILLTSVARCGEI